MRKISRWDNFEEWKAYGIGYGYNKRNYTSLQRSRDRKEKLWYNRGMSKKWLKDFNFKNLIEKSPWTNFKEWKKYGLEHKFEKRNPKSLSKSKDKKERSWHNKGQAMEWLKDFSLNRRTYQLNTFEEWKAYGLEHGFDKRNPYSLSASEKKWERSWYNKGINKKWLKKFDFNFIKKHNKFNTFKDWEKYGLKNEYNKRNPKSVVESRDKDERSWYSKGQREGWLKDFNFKRLIEPRDKFNNFKDWEKYGFGYEFEKRNPKSLSKSKDKKERHWYNRGMSKKWLKDFPFSRIKNKINLSDSFISLLEKDETTRNLAALAVSLGEEGYDIEEVIIKASNGKFEDLDDLHKLLQDNTDKILFLVEQGFVNLGKYIGEFSIQDKDMLPILLNEALMKFPKIEISYNLEERLIGVLRVIYGPKFNTNPRETISEIREKKENLEGKAKTLYQTLENHYQETINLIEELYA